MGGGAGKGLKAEEKEEGGGEGERDAKQSDPFPPILAPRGART